MLTRILIASRTMTFADLTGPRLPQLLFKHCAGCQFIISAPISPLFVLHCDTEGGPYKHFSLAGLAGC